MGFTLRVKGGKQDRVPNISKAAYFVVFQKGLGSWCDIPP
jgi:hypothetical protein